MYGLKDNYFTANQVISASLVSKDEDRILYMLSRCKEDIYVYDLKNLFETALCNNWDRVAKLLVKQYNVEVKSEHLSICGRGLHTDGCKRYCFDGSCIIHCCRDGQPIEVTRFVIKQLMLNNEYVCDLFDENHRLVGRYAQWII
jgi:hypothetical protein